MTRRTPEHYSRMLTENPNATIGVTLAARMVYAATHGDADEPDERLRDIVRRLKAKYGENLSPQECRREIAVVLGGRGGKSGTGAAKARTTEQARTAAHVRWAKEKKEKGE